MSGNALGQLIIITALASALVHIGWRNAYITLGVVNLLIVVPLVIAFVRSDPDPAQPTDSATNPLTSTPSPSPALPVKTIFGLPPTLAAAGRVRHLWLSGTSS